ncbi:MAG: type IV pili twitching motility protein PilT, partial [Acidobacteriota bacterium]|nr:type IV pili twitching motility protein PilT [Acidobacteriota bacterium]
MPEEPAASPLANARDPREELVRLLRDLVGRGGSDLHLSPGAAPRLRIDGRLTQAEGEPLPAAVVESMVSAGLPQRQRAVLEQDGEADYAFTLTGVARFRGSVFRCRGTLAAVYRVVPGEVPSLDALGLPASAAARAGLASGLVLPAGPGGSGKSTTKAAVVGPI